MGQIRFLEFRKYSNYVFVISTFSLVYVGTCYILLKVCISGSQRFLTAGRSDATDLAEWCKGFKT